MTAMEDPATEYLVGDRVVSIIPAMAMVVTAVTTTTATTTQTQITTQTRIRTATPITSKLDSQLEVRLYNG
jgi:hypothetical protein